MSFYQLKNELGVPIPANLDPTDYCLWTICIPNDPEWNLAARNAMRLMTAGRYWKRDERENSIKLAQSISEEILESMRMCNINFDGLEAAFNNIAESLANLECQTNVTVNTSCTSSGGGSLVCIDENGDPTIIPQPIEDDPVPPGGDWPVDPGVDPPPGEDEDWTLFDARACAVSNAVYQMLLWLLTALETLSDIISTLAAGIVLFVGLLPAGVAAAIGGASIIEIVKALVDIAVFEQIGDWLLEARNHVESKKAEIVCLIYENRYNLPGMRSALVSNIMLGIFSVYTLTDEEAAGVRNLLNKIMPIGWLFSWFYEAGTYIAAEEPYDCSLCDEPMPTPQTERLYWLPHDTVTLANDSDGNAAMTILDQWEWHIGGSIPGSSYTWDPVIQGEVPTVPAGHEVLGWGVIWISNYSTAGNDPGDHLIRYNGLTKYPGWKYLRFDTNRDEDLVTTDPVLSTFFDEYSTGSGTWSGTYNHGYYRRAGVSGSGGVVEGIQIQFGWLIKRPAA